MNRTTLLLVAALATAAILVPTGAVPFDPTGADTVSDDVVLRPADGPNGDYALMNERDELELLLTDANPAVEGEGVSADAVTPIPGVFTVTYTGQRRATVWLTDDAEDVRFYRGRDSADSLEGRANSVVLGPNQTVTVGLLVDTRGENDIEQAETFAVTAEIAESDGGDDDNGGDDRDGNDRETPTATRLTPDDGGDATTPTPTDRLATEGSADGPPADGDESDVGGLFGTPSRSPTATAAADGGGAAAELGGGALGPLVAVGAGLLSVLAALAGYRRVG